MSNSFDFELVASDQATKAIERINEAIRDLEPKLDKTKEGLQLGGQETLDGLNGFISRFENLSKNARDNVKWFTEFGHLNRGDMLTSEQHRCHNEKKKFQRRV